MSLFVSPFAGYVSICFHISLQPYFEKHLLSSEGLLGERWVSSVYISPSPDTLMGLHCFFFVFFFGSALFVELKMLFRKASFCSKIDTLIHIISAF